MSHLNWLMGLGGDLYGTLPNPELSAQAYLKAQIFGPRFTSPHNVGDAQLAIAYSSFARKQALTEMTGYIQDASVSILKYGNPSYVTNVQDVIHSFWSSTSLTGFDITNNGDGTINLTAGEAMLRSGLTANSDLFSITVSATTNFSLVDQTLNYVYIDYNNGSPNINKTTSLPTDPGTNKVLIYSIVREGNQLSIVDARNQGTDLGRKIRRQLLDCYDFVHVLGGTAISATGTSNFAVTAGAFYYGLGRIDHPAFDTSGADTFEYYYRNGVGGWTIVTGQHAIDTLHYDNGTGTLANTGNNKFVNHYVYMINDSPSYLVVQYGQNEWNTLAQAQVETVPSSPPNAEGVGSLIGRIIVQKGVAVFADIETAFGTVFTPSTATNHNNLAGLQGGTFGEYYHLTSAQSSALPNVLSGEDASVIIAQNVFSHNRTTSQSTSSGSGSVTSINVAGSDILTFSGGPVTSTGTITAQTGSILAFAAAHG